MVRMLGKYELLGLLGSGGMGVVYLARDVVLDRHVALKVLDRQMQQDSVVVQRFLNEARLAAGLNHANVVTIHDFGKEAGIPFIAMECLAGEPLKLYIEKSLPPGLGLRLHLAAQVARGLEYAHGRAIVHRDVKPGNIQVLPSGDVKLLDFGIAKIESIDLTQTGMMIGTPGYASPEQTQSHPVTPASDVFSFGVVLYELLAGRKPFEAESTMSMLFKTVYGDAEPLRVEDRVPPELESLVLSCLSKKPDLRPGMGAVLTQLRQLQRSVGGAEAAEAYPWMSGQRETQPIPPEVLSRTVGPSTEPGIATGLQQGLPGPRAPTPDALSSTFELLQLAAAAPTPALPAAVSAVPTSKPAAALAGSAPAAAPGEAATVVAQAGLERGWTEVRAEAGAVPEVSNKFLGARTAIELESRVVGEMARTEFDFFNAEVRRVARSIGHVNTLGKAFEWNDVDHQGNRIFYLKIAPRAGFTSVRIEESLEHHAKTLFGGFLGGLGGGGIMLALAIGVGMYRSMQITLLLWALFILLAYLLARYFYTAKARSRAFQLRRLLERLSEHIAQTSVPESTPGNQPYRPSRSRART